LSDPKIETFPELSTELLKFNEPETWIFRGHSDVSWKLIPIAGRQSSSDVDSDYKLLLRWREKAIEYVRDLPDDRDSLYEWGAIARHHGLATRYLDWTVNPLAAAFFAVEDESPNDAALYALNIKSQNKHYKGSPFAHKGIRIYQPRAINPRIIRQVSVFTIHGPSTLDLELALPPDTELRRIIISNGFKQQLAMDLSFFGINRASLFPGLDGLSDYFNWASYNSL